MAKGTIRAVSGRGGYGKSGNEVHSTMASNEDEIKLLLSSESSRRSFLSRKQKKPVECISN